MWPSPATAKSSGCCIEWCAGRLCLIGEASPVRGIQEEVSAMDALKLFAVLLGGNPEGAGVEVHDVVFAVGPSIEAIGDQLQTAWFAKGSVPHIDSWTVLDAVDGAVVELATTEAATGERDLWHVHLGFYEAGTGCFSEGHESLFVVARSAEEAKRRAKAQAARPSRSSLHTDALHHVSDRLAAWSSPYRVRIGEATATDEAPQIHDGYLPFAT